MSQPFLTVALDPISQDAVPQLHVKGVSDVQRMPNLMFISMGIFLESEDVSAAITSIDATIENIMSALEALGLSSQEYSPGYPTVTPISNGEQVPSPSPSPSFPPFESTSSFPWTLTGNPTATTIGSTAATPFPTTSFPQQSTLPVTPTTTGTAAFTSLPQQNTQVTETNLGTTAFTSQAPTTPGTTNTFTGQTMPAPVPTSAFHEETNNQVSPSSPPVMPPSQGADSSWVNVDSIVRYRVQNEIYITTTKFDLASDIIKTCTANGANTLNDISYSYDSPAQMQKEAIQAAGTDALQKARLLANTAGTTVGQVLFLQLDKIEVSKPTQIDITAYVAGSNKLTFAPPTLHVYAEVTQVYEITPRGTSARSRR